MYNVHAPVRINKKPTRRMRVRPPHTTSRAHSAGRRREQRGRDSDGEELPGHREHGPRGRRRAKNIVSDHRRARRVRGVLQRRSVVHSVDCQVGELCSELEQLHSHTYTPDVASPSEVGPDIEAWLHDERRFFCMIMLSSPVIVFFLASDNCTCIQHNAFSYSCCVFSWRFVS